MWATLRDMYTGLRSAVKVGSEVSSEYAVEQGLMEGAILSPFLYTVFIDGLTQRLEAQNLGCRFTNGGWAGALYYADDLCMMATSDSEMQKMLRVLDEYCRDWQFQPAYSKTKVLRYGGCRQNKTELFLPSMHHETKPGAEPVVVDQGAGTDSNPVAEAEEYKYLGVVFQTDRKFSKHAKAVVAAGVRTAGFQLRRYHVVPQGLGMAANSKVFGALVRPHVEYCASTWAPVQEPEAYTKEDWNVQLTNAKTIETEYTRGARMAVGGTGHAHKSAIFNQLHTPPVYLVWCEAVLRFWDRLRRLPDHRLAKQAYCAAVQSENSFFQRVLRAHVKVHGRVPTQAEWKEPGESKAATKQERKDGVERATRQLWSDTMADQREVEEDYTWRKKRDARGETREQLVTTWTGGGGGWCCSGTPPWSTDGFLWQVQHGQYSGAGIRGLESHRTHGSYLASRTGGLRANAEPWEERRCTMCADVRTAGWQPVQTKRRRTSGQSARRCGSTGTP